MDVTPDVRFGVVNHLMRVLVASPSYDRSASV